MIKIKNKKLRFVITFLAVLLSALLQTFVIESFSSLKPAGANARRTSARTPP